MKTYIILFLIFISGILYSQSPKIQYKCNETKPSVQSARFSINIFNTGTQAINLSDLRVRYYFTSEGTSGEQFACDFAPIDKTSVHGTFASGYLEITFANTGTIQPGGSTGEFQVRFNRADWLLLDQGNDYSFDPTKIISSDWDRITVYRYDSLIWGVPGPESGSFPTPVVTSFPNLTPLPTSTPIQSGTASPTYPPISSPLPAPVTGDWLHVEGNCIKDRMGRVVRLTGTNWFGFNTPTSAFDGLWSCDLKESLNQMARRGFNVLRIPISTEMIHNWSQGIFPLPSSINTYQINSYLVNKNSLEVLDITLAHLKSIGMKAIIDVHSALSDAQGHMHPLWYKDWITPAIFNSSWEWIANRYKSDDTIIGVDLKNEPHGVSWTAGEYAKWDNSLDENNWKRAVESVSTRILSKNPGLLILVEGIESFPLDGVTWTSTNQADYSNGWWGGNLRPVATMPITFNSAAEQVVYAPHEYGPNVFIQTWFYPGFNEQTLYSDCWYPNWYFIVEQGRAPVYIGEWGGKLDRGDNEKWMYALRDFIIRKNLHHTYWCFNANSSDTAGLVSNDWKTWDEEKYMFIRPSLWQDSYGRFVGLDQEVPLFSPSAGMTIGEYYQNGNPAPYPEPQGTPAPTVTTVPTATPGITPINPEGTPVGRLGDVNADGAISIVDALLVAQFYVGYNPPGFNPAFADINRDGRVDITDALWIAQVYVGIRFIA